VACGGFSYGDVLGAGEGWAKSILFHQAVRDDFVRFFERNDTFSLGFLQRLPDVPPRSRADPGHRLWPRSSPIAANSTKPASRWSRFSIRRSVVLRGMNGSFLPIATAHGEGRAGVRLGSGRVACATSGLVAFRYVNATAPSPQQYPRIPVGRLTALQRFERRRPRHHHDAAPRTFDAFVQNSWRPDGAGEWSGWMRLFRMRVCSLDDEGCRTRVR